MPTAYERRLIAGYLANAAARLRHGDREASELAEWLGRPDHRAALDREGELVARLEDFDLEEPLSARQYRRLREALDEEREATKGTELDVIAQRLHRLGDATGLTPVDIDILELLLRYQSQPLIESLVDYIFDRKRSALNLRGAAMPTLLGLSADAVQRRFANAAPLVSSGLVVIDGRDGDVKAADSLQRLVNAPDSEGLDVNRLLLDVAPASELRWEDFEHIAERRDHVERLMRGALQSGKTGVNVLIYGAPGTGKTEFCKVLAERLGVTLHTVGEDDDGDEPHRRERLQDLRLAQRLVSPNRTSLLLFEEFEDLLDPSAGALSRFFGGAFHAAGDRGSKVYMNRLLENAPSPTLWTMNDARSLSPNLVRRMMYTLELRPPTPRVNADIWERQLERHGIEANPGDAQALARDFAVTPGVAAGATAAAAIMGGGIETVRLGVRALAQALGCGAPTQAAPPLFDVALIQSDTDPAELADDLANSGESRLSICLQGAPGTGKSAFIRYLAERLGLEVVQKRASDLLSKWVGETEQRIAGAFAEARDAGAFLVFDEADSLLADRRSLRNNWEVGHVNEMLGWMESHPLPFACTTNFAEHLDPATHRRFLFKVKLDYLEAEQVERAFQLYFGFEPPAQAATLTTLTPGDFASVHRQARIKKRLDDPEALWDMLRAECDVKPNRPCNAGFAR